MGQVGQGVNMGQAGLGVKLGQGANMGRNSNIIFES